MCEVGELEPCEVWDETERKARKIHTCNCCLRKILKGERYWIHFSVFEGTHNSEKMCSECYADRKKFCDAHGGQLCQPHYLPRMIRDCIYEDEEGTAWKPMYERITARRQAHADVQRDPGLPAKTD